MNDGPTYHAARCMEKIRQILSGERIVRFRRELGGPDIFAEVEGIGMGARVRVIEREPGSDDE